MKYYGIKTPDNSPEYPSYIWWIADSPHNSWMSFFQFPSKDGNKNFGRYPLGDAIRAYQGIGYTCVELEVTIKEVVE